MTSFPPNLLDVLQQSIAVFPPPNTITFWAIDLVNINYNFELLCRIIAIFLFCKKLLILKMEGQDLVSPNAIGSLSREHENTSKQRAKRKLAQWQAAPSAAIAIK